jgi:hypothetical protein
VAGADSRAGQVGAAAAGRPALGHVGDLLALTTAGRGLSEHAVDAAGKGAANVFDRFFLVWSKRDGLRELAGCCSASVELAAKLLKPGAGPLYRGAGSRAFRGIS